jgi:hypothetical protein
MELSIVRVGIDNIHFSISVPLSFGPSVEMVHVGWTKAQR